ncbi:subtilisin-like serine protease-like protein PR1A [Mytilinidion resinicola]|uniref:Subtilisin-like serine protease-like protein PR1A n=1 Tax=Mytilinidion resinicola TaxID=574789 RepID=A0A6A6YGI4_9PEZI|nr:subtilisin-like serine protease-like protein PR1A [Mytilinidion resinicola]KAF2807145.1 subtilisin-like serine protease-like protein PR1A [Mytilinidion resinicola]
MKDAIPNSYIVVYNDKVDFAAVSALESELSTMHAKRNDGLKGIGTKWSMPGLKGFKIETDEAGLAKIQSSSEVAYIEQEGTMKVNGIEKSNELVYQPGAVWGLSRISHTLSQGCGNDDYIYDYSAGTGTRAYIIDTGIYLEHNEFGGRAIWGANFVPGAPDHDDYGHGTHVAGTIGGGTYGVSKNITLVAVKVLNSYGSGSWEYIISGIEWVVTNAMSLGITNSSVINMSLGGSRSEVVNQAVRVATSAGMAVVVAAGNSNDDSIYWSPASEPSAVTVAATDCTDTRADFSNFGPIVDLFAPGVNVTSSWTGCPGCVETISGTSMSTPHVAGLIAYLIAYNSISATQAIDVLHGLATKDLVKDPGAGTPNLLAYNGDYW